MQTISAALQAAIEATSAQTKPRVIAEWNYNQYAAEVSAFNPSGWSAKWWRRDEHDYDDVNDNLEVDRWHKPSTIDYTNFPVQGIYNNINTKIDGHIVPLYSETYTFHVTTDDGVRVWVNNSLKLNKWTTQATTTHTFTMSLVAGRKYKVTVEHFERTGAQRLALEWSSASQAREFITNADGDFWHDIDGNDRPELYDINSIIKPHRPTSGMPIAIASGSKVSTDTEKYYIAGENNPYKIWATPNASTTDAKPTVLYDKAYAANKIRIVFEVSWVTPTVNIQTTTNGTTWTTVASGVTPGANGVLEYYWNGTSWSTTYNISSTTNIRGIRAVVTSLSKVSRAFVIEMSLRKVQDLSSDVITFDVNQTKEEIDVSLPVGYASSSTASIALANDDGKYDPNNSGSSLYGLIDNDVQFTIEVGYDTTPHGGAGYEYIKLGKFYSESWSTASDSAEATVECRDFTKYLQDIKVPKVFYQSKTAEYIVEDLLARVGINDVAFDTTGASEKIPYLWYKTDVSIWDALLEIARADQASFHIDVNGTFRWQTRQFLYAQTSEWTIASNKDLISLSNNYEVYANTVKITYKKYRPHKFEDGRPRPSILWRPESNVVLNSAPITRDLNKNDERIYLSSTSTWPASGIVNIEGEYIEYDSKTSSYLNVATRGLFNTPVRNHAAGMPKHFKVLLTENGNPVGGGQKVCDGKLWLWNQRDEQKMRWRVWQTGSVHWSYTQFGTKFRFQHPLNPPYNDCHPYKFNSGEWHGIGGLGVMMGGNGRGYYIEVVTNHFQDNFNPSRGNIVVYKMTSNFTRTYLGPNGGAVVDIHPGVDYQLDVYRNGSNYTVYLNGTQMLTFSDSTYTSGRWAVFTRANTVMSFEYLYGAKPKLNPNLGLEQLADRINGGWQATRPNKRNWKGKRWIFHEFNPPAHEAKTFDVEYQVSPALRGIVYSSNDWEAQVMYARHNAFGNEFLIENTSRNTATLHGDDFSVFTGEAVRQTLVVYGQIIEEVEARPVTYKNDDSIRKHGVRELEITSPWIQTDTKAKEIAKFIRDQFGSPTSVAEVSMVPNPALELGDVVTVSYPEKNINKTYHIIGHRVSFSEGLTGSASLKEIVT